MKRQRQFIPVSHGKRKIRIAVVSFVVLVLIAIPVTRNGIHNGIKFLGVGVASLTHSTNNFFTSIIVSVESKNSLQKENEALQSQISELNSRLLDRDVLASDNAEMKSALGRTDGLKFTLASVISNSSNSFYNTFLIDGGRNAGLTTNQVVYAFGQNPIGYITESLSNSATVQLYSTPSEIYEGRLSPENIDVTLTGQGGGNFTTTVPRDLNITDGSVVVTKDIHSRVVAVYKKVTSDPRDPFQTLLLISPVNLNQLSFVEVAQ